MLIKVILDLFICNIDAQLLKRICLKVLKAKNVQEAHRQRIATLKAIKEKKNNLSYICMIKGEKEEKMAFVRKVLLSQ